MIFTYATWRVCRGLRVILRQTERIRNTKNCSAVSSLLDVLRRLSTSPRFHSTELNHPLKQWTLVVNPFSTVRVQLRCSISVRSLDPHSFPDANRAFITVNGTRADQGLKLDNFHVQYNDQIKELLIISEKVNSNVFVELTTPIKSDLYIATSGEGNVNIENMECDNCMVVTENGNCVLHSIKSHRVVVQSTGGDVTGSGTIHGNVTISTSGNSMVDIKKIQGTSMNVSTEHGPLRVKTIYAESSSLTSSSGNIELGSVHGDSRILTERGNITIDSSNGCLKVSSREGCIDAYVGQHGEAELLSEQGSISMRVPVSMKARVLLCGASVEISADVDLREAKRDSTETLSTVTGHLNGKDEEGPWIKAQAERGVVTLRTQSWFESLKIGS